jgi:hypothetical protein
MFGNETYVVLKVTVAKAPDDPSIALEHTTQPSLWLRVLLIVHARWCRPL